MYKRQELAFVLKGLSTEDQLVADSMINRTYFFDKYGDDLLILPDTVNKIRTMGLVALSVETLNGQTPVDDSKTFKEQFKQRLELQEELMTLNGSAIDRIIAEYNKLVKKQQSFYQDLEDNVKKS